MIQAEPHYFEFFKIPFSGKLVDKDAQGFVYISEQFKEQLQRDSIAGSVTLDGKEYRIAGTYRALNREDTQSSSVGSVFLVNPQAYTYYFKTLLRYYSGRPGKDNGDLPALCTRDIAS